MTTPALSSCHIQLLTGVSADIISPVPRSAAPGAALLSPAQLGPWVTSPLPVVTPGLGAPPKTRTAPLDSLQREAGACFAVSFTYTMALCPLALDTALLEAAGLA